MSSSDLPHDLDLRAAPAPAAPPRVLAAVIERVDAAWERGDTETAMRLLTVALWPLFLDRPADLARLLRPIPEKDVPAPLLLAKRLALPIIESPGSVRLLATRSLDAAAPGAAGSELGWHITQRMLAHRLRGEIAEAREVGDRLRRHLSGTALHEPTVLPPFTAAAFAQLGTTELLAGRPAAALIEYRRAVAAADDGADRGVRRDAMVKQACVLAMEGRLRDAEAMLERARAEREPSNAYVHRVVARERLVRALIAVERMDPHAPHLLDELDADRLYEYWPLVLLARGRWALATGNTAGALDLIDAAEGEHVVPPDSLASCVTASLREEANELLGLAAASAPSDPQQLAPLCALSATRGLLARADPLVAVQATRELARRRGVGPSIRLEALMLTAWALQRAQLPDDPRISTAATALAESEGLWRAVMLVPESVRESLGITVPGRLGRTEVPEVPPAVALTPRESEVLAELSGPDQLVQIAALLHVSVNSVKSQVRSLYRRLGVGSRRDAVAEATRLGLLPRARQSDDRDPATHGPGA